MGACFGCRSAMSLDGKTSKARAQALAYKIPEMVALSGSRKLDR